MELQTIGRPGAPGVLLLGDDPASFEELYGPLRELERDYLLLIPVFSPEESETDRLAALEDRLLQNSAGRLWGAWGRRRGATRLLALISRGRVLIRTVILDGAFDLPETLPRLHGRLICWKNARDKAAEESWKALGQAWPPVHSLTLKKLKKKENLLSRRPDLMAARLRKAMGKAVTVSRTVTLPGSTDRVWRELRARPAGRELSVLSEREPLRRLEDEHVQILDGSGKGLRLWSHMTRLEPLEDGRTRCTDQVELDAGRLNVLARPLTRLYLRDLQARRRRELTGRP